MKRSIVAAITGLTLFSSTLAAATEAAVAQASKPLKTIKATMQSVASESVVDALIEAVNRTTVSAQTSGRVVEVLVDVDDYVEKGAVIVRFRDKEQRAALKAAKAKAQEAEANFERIRELLAKKLVSKAEFDKAEAGVKAARAGLEQAQEQLEYTVVRAPYSGIVVERHVEPGELANPGTPLMTGISLENLRAVANLPQQHIATVRSLGRARVILGEGGASVEGEKLTISPYADPVSHTFKVRVDLPQGQHGVYPGMFVKVAFVTGERQHLVVPLEAVVHRSEVTALYVIAADGTISMRQIRAGRPLGDGTVEILAGLQAGEQVALDPIQAGILLKQKRAGQ